jgi:trk system potassium uptake protein
MATSINPIHSSDMQAHVHKNVTRDFLEKIRRTVVRLPSPLIVVSSFLFTIALGTSLLCLPFAHSGDFSLLDALFTATSAACVTGLSVVDTGTKFTFFGQLVIVFLMQIGGIGIMTCSVAVFHLLGKQICHRDRLVLQEVFGISELRSFLNLLKLIFGTALLVETIGTIFLWFSFSDIESPSTRLWYSLFHSISAFCNAGFSLFPDSLVRYQTDWGVNFTVIALIFLGGIGFPTLFELNFFLRNRKKQRTNLSMQSKVVFTTTFLLIILGTLFLFLIEQNHSLSSYSVYDKILICLFHSVTSRTAGFNTIDMTSFSDASILVVLGLMFIGAAPGSCAGGVKVTTVAVLFGFIYSKIRGFKRPTLFYRSVSSKSVAQSMILLALAVVAITLSLFIFLITHNTRGLDHMFLPLLFESVSAFATVGLSIGATVTFTPLDKVIAILLMFIGRVGIFSFGYLVLGLRQEKRYEFAEDSLMIG